MNLRNFSGKERYNQDWQKAAIITQMIYSESTDVKETQNKFNGKKYRDSHGLTRIDKRRTEMGRIYRKGSKHPSDIEKAHFCWMCFCNPLLVAEQKIKMQSKLCGVVPRQR